MALRILALTALLVLARAAHSGSTHLEVGSWTARRAIQAVCNKAQGRVGYRLCLAGATNDAAKHTAIAKLFDDQCKTRACEADTRSLEKIKNCFNSVRVVNADLPYRPWHAELFEDIMVGCLAKENLSRVIRFGPYSGPPYTIQHLRNLLNGAFKERKDLIERIVLVCESVAGITT